MKEICRGGEKEGSTYLGKERERTMEGRVGEGKTIELRIRKEGMKRRETVTESK